MNTTQKTSGKNKVLAAINYIITGLLSAFFAWYVLKTIGILSVNGLFNF